VRSAAEYAAFVNATFGHGFEIDDFAPAAIGHPGCVAVPASLNVGEREHLSGKDLLTGVALASEVITRVGESGMKWMLARGFHETCILGVLFQKQRNRHSLDLLRPLCNSVCTNSNMLLPDPPPFF
jgi:hypothetical protein